LKVYPSQALIYTPQPLFCSLPYHLISDLRREKKTLPHQFFPAPTSLTISRFLGLCRTSAAIWWSLERRQIFLQSLLSVDLRSTTRVPVLPIDCSLQFGFSFPPRNPGEVYEFLSHPSYFPSWPHLYLLEKTLLGFLVILMVMTTSFWIEFVNGIGMH